MSSTIHIVIFALESVIKISTFHHHYVTFFGGIMFCYLGLIVLQQMLSSQIPIKEHKIIIKVIPGLILEQKNNLLSSVPADQPQNDDSMPRLKKYLETLKWDVLLHLPYSADIASSDYSLF